MSNQYKPMAEKLTWKQARADVMAVNPGLAEAIDNLDPSDDYLLIKARYPFGCKILDKGVLQMPNAKGEVLPISDESVDPQIQEMLGYAKTMPIGIVLNKAIELYLTFRNKIIPFSMMRKGKLFSLWSALEVAESAHLGRTWSIMAGARSLIMLPKISDNQFYKKIKREFSLYSQIPNNLLDQWNIFAELAKHKNFPDPWYVENLYFSKEWVQNNEDKRCKLFRNFLVNTLWLETSFLRNQVITDFAFSCALDAKNLKPNPYLMDTIKHLYLIGIGAYPGFVIAEDDRAAPVAAFQKIFNDIYDLKYLPTMMHPGYISANTAMKPCYYSLEFPTLMSFSPKSRQNSTKRDDLREIAYIMNNIQTYLLEDSLGLFNTPIYKWVERINYDYFHSEPDEKDSISDANTLIDKDYALFREQEKYKKNFCTTSPFVRGCIRISIKN